MVSDSLKRLSEALHRDISGGPVVKESTYQFSRHKFDPWTGEIPTCLGTTKPMCHNY